MVQVKGKRRVDATEGPMFSKMLFFVIPLMLTNLLNNLYNMADNIVIGQFSGDPTALAAIGVTGSLNSFFVNFAVGISAGAGVIVARNFGAKDKNGLSRSVHTAIALSVIVGIIIGILRFILSEGALVLMGTRAELLPNSVLYCKILALGMPGTIVFTFSSAVLRSVGDSKTSLYAAASTGILNVILNLFFVLVCGMSVAGVALATVVAKYASAAITMCVLIKRRDEDYAFDFKKLCLDRKMVKDILYIGIPSAVQSVIYSVTNIFATAAANPFPLPAISAKTVATNIDTLLGSSITTYLHATLTFASQNYGAKKPERIKKSIFIAAIQSTIIGLSVGLIMLLFREQLVGMYLAPTDPDTAEILKYATEIMVIMLPTYFIGAISDSLSGFLRGLGASISAMVSSILGVCAFRIAWIFFIFPYFKTLTGLYMMYPVSWTITIIASSILSIIAFKKAKREILASTEAASEPAVVKVN